MNMQPHVMSPLDCIMLVYFIVVIVLINWKGQSFLTWGRTHRWQQTAVALGLFIPWALYILAAHL